MIIEEMVDIIERQTRIYNEKLSPLKAFILPSGSLVVSHTHLILVVTRRLERILTPLIDGYSLINLLVLVFIDRLSDYFFVVARIIVQQTNIEEVYWVKPKI